MHVILTHEQADFDALASLLGAYLLDENALPVLPRRLNRNVQAFLTLYGNDLPFFDQRDLPNQQIDTVTLVDTQSMVSVKGMSQSTKVFVVDHHPGRENTSPDWTITRSETGATTTFLVDALSEQDTMLTTTQATLLLLGIYEDTGSLTYTSTTPQDLRAAAYLLDQAANLQVAANFLHHPISPTQQLIYDKLRENSEFLTIHGYTIVVAAGDARDMDEELSTIAHKLRDLLDPDALFVLVRIRSGIQMIARSTNDNIDVAQIVSKFGGGGHERAAAALIRGKDLLQVHHELVTLLPAFVRPAVTVSQIMSREPQLLSPWVPIEEVALRMRRYGYEGYPVVQDGEVIGLLTRRAVDRAIAHNWQTSATSVMDAGSFTVRPHDSIEYLQRLMTSSGWGQIPVVSPETGEIIGIVTRTDLLKILSPEAVLPGRNNLAVRLESALPESRITLLKTIAKIAHEQHTALYIVGGFVRDLWLDRPSFDFDLVVEGEAIKLAHILAKEFGGRVTSHSQFGTAKWHLEGSRFQSTLVSDPSTIPALHYVDLVTARTEFYEQPTALPIIERGSIKLDLHRRDFTINTLALRLDSHHYGELHDYWGGINDLRQGLVRVLHSISFVDDPTRMLRAVRFEQRFQFRIEERTLQLMQEALPLLDRVSGDRIRHELNHIFDDPSATRILRRLSELKLLSSIHPDLTWDAWLEDKINSVFSQPTVSDWELGTPQSIQSILRKAAYVVWLIRLSQEKAEQICLRLKISLDLRNTIYSAIILLQRMLACEGAMPSQIVAALEPFDSLARYAVYLSLADPGLKQMLLDYQARWRKVTPTITGHDLRKIGIPPGPVYRSILQNLRNAWLDDIVTTPGAENTLLNELLQKAGYARDDKNQ